MLAYLAFLALAQTAGQSGLVYVGTSSFLVDAPRGWVMDTKAATKLGLPVVLYPKGFDVDSAPAILYANAAEKSDKAYATVDLAMKADRARSMKWDSKTVFRPATPPVTKDRRRTESQIQISSLKNQGMEQIAYIDTPKSVVFLVLSCKQPRDFAASRPAFDAFVRSFSFVSSQVTYDTPKK